jgi:S-methylmethionine-dependent homocysteine/selenocysteine methylase
MREEGVTGAVAFTLSDSDASVLRSGESLEAALEAIMPFSPDAVLINCSIPEVVTEGLKVVAKSGLRFGGYANGFTSVEALVPGSTVDRLTHRKDLGPEEYLEFVKAWIDLGAEVIGGCCEIGPSHIAAIADYCRREGILTTDQLVP